MRTSVLHNELFNNTGKVLNFPLSDSPSYNFQYKHIEVNMRGRDVKSWGNNIYLQPLEFDLLVVFVKHKGCVLTRDKLLAEVWDCGFDGYARTVDNQICKLRKKLGLKQYLVTVPKIGYKLID